MKSALVTGAGSFIGYEVVRRLTDIAIPTHVLVRPTSDNSRLEALPAAPQIHVTDGSSSSLSRILEQVNPEIVFHFAGIYTREEDAEDIPELIQGNIQFATQLLDAICRKNNSANIIKGIVNTGSYFQYLDSTNAALNLYAATKNAFEQIADYYSERFALPITTLVLFDIFGPRDWRVKLLPAIRDAQSSGSVQDLPKNDLLLNFVHVDDVVDCFLAAAEKLITSPQDIDQKKFAVRQTADVRISEIIALFEKVGPSPVQTNWGNWDAPEREIDVPWHGPTFPSWQPKISLEDGIRQLIESPLNEH